jgi:UV DNA damage repair endonuclease
MQSTWTALTSLNRKTNFKRLPDNVKARVVLENDEICYCPDDRG